MPDTVVGDKAVKEHIVPWFLLILCREETVSQIA